MSAGIFHIENEEAMHRLAATFAGTWTAGDIVLLDGNLGAGKTTFVRGFLAASGWEEAVRSPTFNLMQVYDLDPPVVHADLYRLKGAAGIGLENYLDTYICLIEWPDRLGDMIDPSSCWRVEIEFADQGRIVTVIAPNRA